MKFLLKDSDFNIPNSGVLAVYFYSDWLLVHKKILLNIKNLTNTVNINFIGIDINYFNSFKTRYQIKSIPTIVIFKDGREVKRFGYLLKFEDFKKQFINLLEPDISLSESGDKNE